MLNIADLIGMVRRRLGLVLVLVVVAAVLSALAALRQPHVYETAAVLQVELPRVSSETSASQVVSRSSQRLQLLEQELLSREALSALSARHGLFADTPGLSTSQQVQILRGDIRIETVRAGRDPFGGEQPVSAMLLVVRQPTAALAAAVANDLADQVLVATAARQSAQVRETLDFYISEEQRLGRELAALEAQITAYKNDNVDALPEGIQSRRDDFGRAEDMLREIDGQLLGQRQELALLSARGSPRVIEQRQIATLEAQIATLEGRRDEALQRRARVEAANNRAPSVETQLGTFARQLQQLQEQYGVLTRRRAEAETSQRLNTEQQTERFEILEAALPPEYPVASGRRKILVMGVGLGLMAGLALAYLLEMRNPVLRTARALERQLDLRPVIVLPDLAKQRGGSGPLAWVRRRFRRSGRSASSL